MLLQPSDRAAKLVQEEIRMANVDLSIAIGGAAGQGIATPGDILARIFVRRGLHLNAYNAYQSIIRGGHIFLTLRTSDQPVLSHGDKLDVLMPLNQDSMNRHLRLMKEIGRAHVCTPVTLPSLVCRRL